MPEAQPPPLPGEPVLPVGRPRYAWFAGILEGRFADRTAVETAVADLRRLDLTRVELEFEGDRFSVLLDERPIPPAAVRPGMIDEVRDVLDALARASSQPQTIESTLRCTEVFDDTVVETLFAQAHGVMGHVSRVRAATADDRQRDPAAPLGQPTTSGFSPMRTALIAVLMLIAFSMLVWQGGVLERIWSTPPEQLQVDTGLFDGLLDVTVESSFGNYRVAVRRGADYPTTTAEVSVLEATAETTADRAAVVSVADGAAIHVRIESEDGEVLQFIAVQLRPLLVREDAEAVALLPGRMNAHTVRLSLESGH